MPSPLERPVPAIRLGAVAARLLLSPRRPARIAAVFERSFYIEADGAFACVGGAAIGDGPLNVLVREDGVRRLLSGVARDQPAVVGEGRVEFPGEVVVDARTAEVWRPPAWPCSIAWEKLDAMLDAVVGTIAAEAGNDGLAQAVVGGGSGAQLGGAAGAVLRTAGPRIAALRRWLEAMLSASSVEPSTGAGAPVDLLGLGHGLTPSGDDFLAAVLITLEACGRKDVQGRLSEALLPAARKLTTPLSAAFLSAAGEGLGSGAAHAFIAALMQGEEAAVLYRLRELGSVGHTSGWDAATGVAMTFAALRTTSRG